MFLTSQVQARFPDNQAEDASLALGHLAELHSKEIQNVPSCLENGNGYHLNMIEKISQILIVSYFLII